ncbi:porin [Paracoccus pantotrophus]|uniref:porin n=1 Tax=Paracoccus pantotrophus TaxID=82367 RepID=UPI0008E83D84|nr:porin [Paracoccus pantotrophus]MDF3852672.1 porin [Paracoccus pantotrophus]SFN75728.1 outer membrane protein OmpU [Paracoccus pantotrophus]
MKKALIASTALLLTAGVAAADVKISGYGRTGVIYYENDSDLNESRVVSRLRMNIDASSSTDSGVDFGARFRLQWDQGNGLGALTADDELDAINGLLTSRGQSAATNAGKLWVSAQGFTVEVGNVDTAFDSNGLIYATELGSYDRSVGFSDVTGAFFAYEAGPYALQHIDRVGIRALYTLGDLTLQASYVDPDQSGLIDGELLAGMEEEFGFSVDYTWNERLELSAAAAFNGAGIDGNDIYFLGARYAVMDNARIGLNFVDAGDEEDGYDGKTIALYGDYTLADGRTNLEAYIANNDRDSNETDNAFGIGVNYDLGGARLGASLQRDYAENVTADFGVRFEF